MAQPHAFDPTATGPAARRRGHLVAAPDAPESVVALYVTHYPSVVRLAAALGLDRADAPAAADGAFVDFAHRRHHPADDTVALCACLLGRCRSSPPTTARAVDPGSGTGPGTAPHVVAGALSELSGPRNEGLVLRHYAGLSARTIATVTGRRLARVRDDVRRGEAEIAARVTAPGPVTPEPTAEPTTAELHELLRAATRSRVAALDATDCTPDPARFVSRLEAHARRRARRTAAVVVGVLAVAALAAAVAGTR